MLHILSVSSSKTPFGSDKILKSLARCRGVTCNTIGYSALSGEVQKNYDDAYNPIFVITILIFSDISDYSLEFDEVDGLWYHESKTGLQWEGVKNNCKEMNAILIIAKSKHQIQRALAYAKTRRKIQIILFFSIIRF